jgi:hypothetical protein
MRLERYLKEEYAEGIKFGSTIFDVYANPTSKELKEIGSYDGYRFLIDVNHKTVYIWDANATHLDVMNKTQLPLLRDFSYLKFYTEGKGADRYFTGHTEDKTMPFKKIYSDTFLGTDDGFHSDFKNAAYSHGENIIKSLNALKKKNLSFVSKWMNPKDILDIIDKTIDMVASEMDSSAEDDDAAE